MINGFDIFAAGGQRAWILFYSDKSFFQLQKNELKVWVFLVACKKIYIFKYNVQKTQRKKFSKNFLSYYINIITLFKE